jgi:hypothetical protein
MLQKGVDPNQMDWLITVIRFPFGLLTLVVLAILWTLAMVAEALAALCTLIYLALSSQRDEAKKSWVQGYPYTAGLGFRTGAKILHWIINDDTPVGQGEVKASAIVIGIVGLGVLVAGALVPKLLKTDRLGLTSPRYLFVCTRRLSINF